MCSPSTDSKLRVLIVSSRAPIRELCRRALASELGPEALILADSVESLTGGIGEAGAVVVVDGAHERLDAAFLARLHVELDRTTSAVLLLLRAEELGRLSLEGEPLLDDFLLLPCIDDELLLRVKLCHARLAAKRRAVAQARALEDSYVRQTQFLSIVSHEIRTPLSAIMSSAGILKRYGRQRPESVERFAGVIQQETRRLTRLINNLLDLAKIEAGQVEWHLAVTRVADLQELIKDSFAALIGERALRLEVSHVGGPSEVLVDRDKIIQVLANLLSNAVKHSPDGGAVHLRFGSGSGGNLRLEVEDEGSGIPAGQEEHIFGRFQQLEVGDERTGTGLGLTISREIVEYHGGRLWAVPGREKGALFVVELPVEAGREATDGSV